MESESGSVAADNTAVVNFFLREGKEGGMYLHLLCASVNRSALAWMVVQLTVLCRLA